MKKKTVSRHCSISWIGTRAKRKSRARVPRRSATASPTRPPGPEGLLMLLVDPVGALGLGSALSILSSRCLNLALIYFATWIHFVCSQQSNSGLTGLRFSVLRLTFQAALSRVFCARASRKRRPTQTLQQRRFAATPF